MQNNFQETRKPIKRSQFVETISDFNKKNLAQLSEYARDLPQTKVNSLRGTIWRKLTYEISTLDDFDWQFLKKMCKNALYSSIFIVAVNKLATEKKIIQKLNFDIKKYQLGKIAAYNRGSILVMFASVYLGFQFIELSYRVGLKSLYIEDNIKNIQED